jgi:hypothetical protein
LQRYSGPAGLHCQSIDREERFGKVQFGARWVGRQTQTDLLLLARARDASRDWQSMGSEDSSVPPVYVGPPGAQDVEGAIDRALRRKQQLSQVRELLALLDRYAGLLNPEHSELSNEELKKLKDAREIAILVSVRHEDHPTVRESLEATFAQLEGSPPPSLDPQHDEWLQEILAHLSVCREVREAIGWDEITERIDPSWLRAKGFGPSTPVDIGALRGKLISETPPRTSGPPKSFVIPTGIDGLAQVPMPNGHFILRGVPTSSNQTHPVNRAEIESELPVMSVPTPEQETAPNMPAAISLPVVAQLGKRVGRSASDVFYPIVRAMLADLANSKTTPEVLAEETKNDLSKTYRGGSEVCNKARATVWVVRAMQADLDSATLTTEVLKKISDKDLQDRYIGFLNNKKFGTGWDILGKLAE